MRRNVRELGDMIRTSCQSGGAALVPVMESANLGELDDSALFRGLYVARLGAVHIQRKMGARSVIVVEIRQQNPAEMSLVQNSGVVEAFASNAPDEAFHVGRLPWAPGRDEHLFDAHVPHSTTEIPTVDPVTISQQVPGSIVPRKGLDNLLCGPTSRGVRRDVEVHDPPPVVGKDDKDEQDDKPRCRHDEEVDADEVLDVILEKRPPRL